MKHPHFIKQKHRYPTTLTFTDFRTKLDKQRFDITPLNIATDWAGKNSLEGLLVPSFHSNTVPYCSTTLEGLIMPILFLLGQFNMEYLAAIAIISVIGATDMDCRSPAGFAVTRMRLREEGEARRGDPFLTAQDFFSVFARRELYFQSSRSAESAVAIHSEHPQIHPIHSIIRACQKSRLKSRS